MSTNLKGDPRYFEDLATIDEVSRRSERELCYAVLCECVWDC